MWNVLYKYENRREVDLPLDTPPEDVRRVALEQIDDPYGDDFWGDKITTMVVWVDDKEPEITIEDDPKV